MASARYNLVAAKSKWEEQAFFFDDALPNYGLEQFLHNRLRELGWFKFCRQPLRAIFNWVLEFYANNADGEDFSVVQGRRVPATTTIINELFDLPNDAPSFYQILEGFEEEDYEVIKNLLCLPNTQWNTTGRNPYSVSRQSLIPEAKLWNTEDQLDQGGLHEEMNVADAEPLNMAMPTPPASPVHEADARVEDSAPSSPAQPSTVAELNRTPPPSLPVIPVSSHTTTTSPATTPAAPAEQPRGRTTETPLGSTPSSPAPSPSAPAQFEEAGSLQYMLLRRQLQRIEARQLHFQNEVKVFQDTLTKFLLFQFPASATFFGQSSTPPPQPSASAAAAAQPSTHTSTKEGATEEVHFLSDDKNDPLTGQLQIPPQGSEARPLRGEPLTRAFHPAQKRRRQNSALPSTKEDTISSLLRVMKMVVTLTFQSSTWNASHEAEKSKHFKECMIQRLCESSMHQPARKRFSRRLKDHVV
ncbi:hypothetical protein GQ457_04G019230 [Hibiscus cannabinus]